MNRLPTALFVVALLASSCWAQEPAQARSLPPTQTADAKALIGLVAEFTRAFEAGDAKAVAATFTEDAQVSDNTGSTRGREAIEARFARYFATNPKSTIAIQLDSLRFLSPDVASETGHAIVKSAVKGSQPETTAYTAFYVRQDGKWLHASLDDRPADDPAIPDRLKDLDWLVGDWVTESNRAVVATTVRWSEDHHYLLRDFTLMVEGKPAVKGTQRIGWDASRRQIRSWLFDSKGGFGEGYWTRAGDHWMIKSHGVGHDGTIATATQLLTRVGRDHLRWSSFDRTIGDQSAADLEEINLVRKPPQPSGK